MTQPLRIIIPCVTCHVPMVPIRAAGGDERPALLLLHCPRCGAQEGQQFEARQQRRCEPLQAEVAA